MVRWLYRKSCLIRTATSMQVYTLFVRLISSDGNIIFSLHVFTMPSEPSTSNLHPVTKPLPTASSRHHSPPNRSPLAPKPRPLPWPHPHHPVLENAVGRGQKTDGQHCHYRGRRREDSNCHRRRSGNQNDVVKMFDHKLQAAMHAAIRYSQCC